MQPIEHRRKDGTREGIVEIEHRAVVEIRMAPVVEVKAQIHFEAGGTRAGAIDERSLKLDPARRRAVAPVRSAARKTTLPRPDPRSTKTSSSRTGTSKSARTIAASRAPGGSDASQATSSGVGSPIFTPMPSPALRTARRDPPGLDISKLTEKLTKTRRRQRRRRRVTSRCLAADSVFCDPSRPVTASFPARRTNDHRRAAAVSTGSQSVDAMGVSLAPRPKVL
jgi:hypothetical protein